MCQPTHGANILDFLATNKPELFSNTQVEKGISDHDNVVSTMKLNVSKAVKKPRRMFMFHKANMLSVVSYLKTESESFYSKGAHVEEL